YLSKMENNRGDVLVGYFLCCFASLSFRDQWCNGPLAALVSCHRRTWRLPAKSKFPEVPAPLLYRYPFRVGSIASSADGVGGNDDPNAPEAYPVYRHRLDRGLLCV